MVTDPKQFWEGKILGWEQGRYDRAPSRSLLERLADRESASLRFRLRIAGELLAPHVSGKRVLDVGCGSGRLAEAVLAAGAASYTGLDIAEVAIAAARARADEEGWNARFHVGGIEQVGDHPSDIVVSLGLTDWLDDDALRRLFVLGGDADFLHAISEKRATPSQWVHRSYVWLAYGHRTGAYIPRYFTPAEMAAHGRAAGKDTRIWRDPGLSFGALVTSLPIGDPIP
jgi:SAM-dependent methyltransferase